VYQVEDSVESLPISQDPVLLSLHFSPPTRQVTFDSVISDIGGETFGDEENAGQTITLGADQVKVAHISKISLSYDVSKVDDQTAAEFLHVLKGLLDDPELLLL